MEGLAFIAHHSELGDDYWFAPDNDHRVLVLRRDISFGCDGHVISCLNT
jgi:hypothetical protein